MSRQARSSALMAMPKSLRLTALATILLSMSHIVSSTPDALEALDTLDTPNARIDGLEFAPSLLYDAGSTHGRDITLDMETDIENSQRDVYEPEFAAFGRSLLGRVTPESISLSNNVPQKLNINPGSTQVYVFELSSIASRQEGAEDSGIHSELRRRQGAVGGIENPVLSPGAGPTFPKAGPGSEGPGGEPSPSRANGNGLGDLVNNIGQGPDRDGAERDADDDRSRTASRDSTSTSTGSGSEASSSSSSTSSFASSSRKVYLSANTCMQVQEVASSGSTTQVSAPQLTMYVSTSSSNTSPGPNADASLQSVQAFTEGAVTMSVQASGTIYVGVAAPNVSSTQLTGIYNVEVAVSVDDYYHSYDNDTDANLIWVDSDAYASLMITHNLTESADEETIESLMQQEPYVMFAQNMNDRSIDGVRLSYCGLQTYAQIAATSNSSSSRSTGGGGGSDGTGLMTSTVATSMTRRGLGNLPKQQFYFSGLNASARYLGILVELPNGGASAPGTANVVGGGGHVTQGTVFSTKAANGNCEVVFNLTFCNETAYAVPSNPTRFTNAALLAQAYDDYAAQMYGNFEKALAQIPCEAPATQRFSLARGCDDCAAAYKNWLCSVAIPRCADFTETDAWLQPRAISQPFPNGTFLDPAFASQITNSSAFNSSRNPFIDDTVAPGPYKEVLPCEDLCHVLAQDCPAAMGFSCTTRGGYGFNTSYGRRTEATSDGAVTCNYPGSAHYFSAGPAGPHVSWLLWLAAGAAFVMM